MNLYLMGSTNGTVVVAAGNRKQALRVGNTYFADMFKDAPPINTCVKLHDPADITDARIIATLTSPPTLECPTDALIEE